MPEKDKITLGSGKLYVAEYTGTVPEVATLCVEENRLGYISGGATLEYLEGKKFKTLERLNGTDK